MIHSSLFDLPSRTAKKVFKPYGTTITVHWGDLRNKEAFDSNLLSGLDTAIHLGAIIPPEADKDDALARAVNTEGTCNLIAGLEKHAPNAKLQIEHRPGL